MVASAPGRVWALATLRTQACMPRRVTQIGNLQKNERLSGMLRCLDFFGKSIYAFLVVKCGVVGNKEELVLFFEKNCVK